MVNFYKLMYEDLQLNNRWYCTFPDFSKASFLVKNVTIPMEKLTTETKKYGEKKYNGFTPVEEITITFFENSSFNVYDFFKDWKDTIFDPITKTFKVLSSVNDKYKSARIDFYGGDLIDSLYSKTFNFSNLMVKGLDDLTLDQESGTPLEWSVTLAVGDVDNKGTVASFINIR